MFTRLFIVSAVVLWPVLGAAQDPQRVQAHAAKPSTATDNEDQAVGAGNQSPTKPAPDDHLAHPAAIADRAEPPLPPISDADRAAAFPPGLEGHATHDRRITAFVLFDQLEWQGGERGGLSIDTKSWIGGDLHRLWLRGEGESSDGRPENAQVHAMYGRSFARWWDVVAGVRQDFRPGSPQAWFAIGVQGLAPQWFEIEATGYLGRAGRTHARVEVEYELLITNRVVLQPLLEAELYGKSDPARGIGAGLSALDAGMRLRYEVRRELAPYVGLTWHRALFGTADYARADGAEVGRVRVAVGLRTWF
jgi:copper resistance protein B